MLALQSIWNDDKSNQIVEHEHYSEKANYDEHSGKQKHELPNYYKNDLYLRKHLPMSKSLIHSHWTAFESDYIPRQKDLE